MSEEKKKKTSKKKKEEQVIVEENFVETEVQNEVKVEEKQVQSVEETVSLESIIEETISEELNEFPKEEEHSAEKFRVNPIFSTEEKLYITKLVANGYRPFDIVKKARATLKLDEEKKNLLSLNIRTIEQLMKALEA
jgi:hypothetical protein